jgi:hypothetical protein
VERLLLAREERLMGDYIHWRRVLLVPVEGYRPLLRRAQRAMRILDTSYYRGCLPHVRRVTSITK